VKTLNDGNGAAPVSAVPPSSAGHVLIAEDDPISRRILESWLQKWNYGVVARENGLDAWNELQKANSAQMAILDWEMPGMDGIEVCRRIRGHQQGPYKYIVLLTAKGGKEDIVSGLEAGADDYLTKPFDANELRARVRAGTRILELQDALLRAQTELQFEASHDHLTGVWNRGAILDLLTRETQRARRVGGPIGVIMADLDHFKQINDSHGHLTGDAVLREAARRMVASVRNYDYVGRYGGEEFLVVLTECDSADLMATAERIRFSIAEKPIETDSGMVPVTLSVGLAAHVIRPDSPGVDLVRAADEALYKAKANGRNRVESCSENLASCIR
jgi:two-component system, cell cycle response regulator